MNVSSYILILPLHCSIILTFRKHWVLFLGFGSGDYLYNTALLDHWTRISLLREGNTTPFKATESSSLTVHSCGIGSHHLKSLAKWISAFFKYLQKAFSAFKKQDYSQCDIQNLIFTFLVYGLGSFAVTEGMGFQNRPILLRTFVEKIKLCVF